MDLVWKCASILGTVAFEFVMAVLCIEMFCLDTMALSVEVIARKDAM